MANHRLGRVYKEVTLQQLRSFCETARLGSLKAAAGELGLAHPTVWQQVHALERDLAARLVEPHGRGCRLTADGRLLAELATPLVAGIDALKRSFQERRAHEPPRLTIASTPRTLIEDLSEPTRLFEKRHPNVQLCFREITTREVTAAVESGRADLGVTVAAEALPTSPALIYEPAYELDHLLVTPRDHPLARQRVVRPRDLLAYPLVNAADGIPDPAVTAALDKLGVFRTQPRRVEAYYTAVIRHYVALGFGIGLVVGRPGGPPHPGLHQRSLSRYFGRTLVHLVWRKGVPRPPHAQAFAQLVKELLGRKRSK